MNIFNSSLSLILALFFSTTIVHAQCGNLYIAGLVDGPLPGGSPKAIQLCATGNIADLSIYGLESVPNGTGSTDLEEYTFTSESLSTGDCVWLTNNQDQFLAYFGFAACYENNVISVNGDDALLLYCNGEVVDVAGDPNNDGSSTAWEYTDGWMYASDTNQNSTFDENQWTYSGPNALDASNTNAEASAPYPNLVINCQMVDCPNLDLNIDDPSDDGDASTNNDVVTSACLCEGMDTGLDNCGTPVWEVISPIPNINASNNFGQWEVIADGFSVNGYCGLDCVEPVSTWLVYGPLNLSSTSTLNLVFEASESFGTTDLEIKYTANYASACPDNATWTTAGTISGFGAANIDLSSASGTAVYIGIDYTDDGADGFSAWDLTNFQLLANTCPNVGTPIVSNCNTGLGCTAATACNYDASANIDDGSCYSDCGLCLALCGIGCNIN